MVINVVTLFPDVFGPILATSIPGRARTAGLVDYRVVALRQFATDRYGTVDDHPYGGGAGMVLKPEPIVSAVESVAERGQVVVMSARGRPLTHQQVVRYSLAPALTIVCGHYKDVDQRVVEYFGADEIAIGDFVLSGGEPAAIALIDAVVRLLPGALGDHESASTDSHYDGLLSPPSYTRPPEFRGLPVPDVLRSGNHAAVAAWKQREAERLTAARRPDLWAQWQKEHEQET